MKKILVLFCLLVCSFSVFAQPGAKNINAYRAQKLDEILKMKAAAAREYRPSAQAWYNGSADDVMEYYQHYSRPQTVAGMEQILQKLFEENDLVLYGESHSSPLAKVLAVKSLVKYNTTVPATRRVTHAFLEYPPSKKAEFNTIERDLAPLNAPQKQAYCKKLAYKENFLKGFVNDYMYCELRRSGVRVEFVDLPSRQGAGENKCCQYFGTCLTGTDKTVFSSEGMTLRNCAMFDVIRPAIAKGGKGVLFVGYGHIPYEFTDYDGVGLGLMAERGLKNKKVSAVIATGGAPAHFEAIDICPKCATTQLKEGPLPHPEFFGLVGREPLFENRVLDVVPSGEENNPIYKNRPADKVLFFSRFYDYHGVAEENYIPRD